MTDSMHPAAEHHLPIFISTPGQTDTLLVLMAVFILTALIAGGVLYFRLHALPEQVAHRGQKVQFELVAVLALLSLFTHNHLFWIAGLLLALIPLPDIKTPIRSIVDSLGKIAENSDRHGPDLTTTQIKPLSYDDQPKQYEND